MTCPANEHEQPPVKDEDLPTVEDLAKPKVHKNGSWHNEWSWCGGVAWTQSRDEAVGLANGGVVLRRAVFISESIIDT